MVPLLPSSRSRRVTISTGIPISIVSPSTSVNCAATSDGHVQVMSATMLKSGDVAMIISNSGRSRDLLDVCEIALRKGATVIVISASGSPLALQAQGPNRILLAADNRGAKGWSAPA